MLNKKFFSSLKQDYEKSEIERRKIISYSNQVLNDAKRAIFSLHRGDEARAEELLAAAETSIKRSQKDFGYVRLVGEGSYVASIEEFVEAKLFYEVTRGGKIDFIKGIKIRHDSYLGGLCDLTGEMFRRAVNMAAGGKMEEVERMKDLINDILSYLVEFDMTGYQRTKFDQAKGNLRKMEQVYYEIKIRK
jgi:predicted translin family RNA/ssDNA-binding protein